MSPEKPVVISLDKAREQRRIGILLDRANSLWDSLCSPLEAIETQLERKEQVTSPVTREQLVEMFGIQQLQEQLAAQQQGEKRIKVQGKDVSEATISDGLQLELADDEQIVTIVYHGNNVSDAVLYRSKKPKEGEVQNFYLRLEPDKYYVKAEKKVEKEGTVVAYRKLEGTFADGKAPRVDIVGYHLPKA